MMSETAPEARSPQPPRPEDLIATAQAVVAEVQALRGDLASKKSLRRTWGFVLFDVALSLAGLGLVGWQFHTNSQINNSLHQNYVTAQQQAITRVRVLCPLYEILLGAASNPAPQNSATPEQKARLGQALATIKDGYKTLGCQPPLTSR